MAQQIRPQYETTGTQTGATVVVSTPPPRDPDMLDEMLRIKRTLRRLLQDIDWIIASLQLTKK